MATRLPEYIIEAESDGYRIYDEYGEDMCPTRVFTSWDEAVIERQRMEAEDIDNYDGPPDGEAWSGGFAKNH